MDWAEKATVLKRHGMVFPHQALFRQVMWSMVPSILLASAYFFLPDISLALTLGAFLLLFYSLFGLFFPRETDPVKGFTDFLPAEFGEKTVYDLCRAIENKAYNPG